MKKNILLSFLSCFVLVATQAQEQKFFRLIASMSGQFQLENGNVVPIWGYKFEPDDTLKLPSPIVVVNVGDTVEIEMVNQSSDAHTIHLHGLDVDQANDGVPSTSQEILTMGSYHFIPTHSGLYIYHCHVKSTVHVQMGMYGLLLVRPRNQPNAFYENGPTYTKEVNWLFSSIDELWQQTAGFLTMVPEFNAEHFYINGVSNETLFQPEHVIEASIEDTVALRLTNISYGSTKVVFPNTIQAVNLMSDGRALPQTIEEDTLEIMPGERYELALTSASLIADTIEVLYFDMMSNAPIGSNKVPVTFTNAVGVKPTIILENKIEISPNPSHATVQVSIPQTIFNGGGRLIIIDTKGNTVKRDMITEQLIDLSIRDLKPGLYSMLFQTGNYVYAQRFVKE